MRINDDRAGDFDELTVKRLNVVADDGSLRLVVSSEERFPDPIVDGHSFKRDDGPYMGLIFYNVRGDECGGLVWGSDAESGARMRDSCSIGSAKTKLSA